MKDEFLSTLSHELRTPLNAILGWASLLRFDSTPAPDDLAQGLETIERNARAQAQLIEELLDMSRIINGKLRLDVQQVDLPIVVSEATESIRPAAEAKGIRLSKVLDPGRRMHHRGLQPPATGPLEPAVERSQIHAARRANSGRPSPRQFSRGDYGHGFRAGNFSRLPAPVVHAILAS